MANFFIFVYITFFYSLILLYSTKTYGKQIKKINILLKKPNVNIQYTKEYFDTLKKYIETENNSNPILKDYELTFSFCKNIPQDKHKTCKSRDDKDGKSYAYDSEYAGYLRCMIHELKNSNFDMMIVDDRFLFSENATVRNTVLESHFEFKENFNKYYLNYNDYINNDDLQHYDSKLLEMARYNNNELFGLPYDLDFDLIYNYDYIDMSQFPFAVNKKSLSSSPQSSSSIHSTSTHSESTHSESTHATSTHATSTHSILKYSKSIHLEPTYATQTTHSISEPPSTTTLSEDLLPTSTPISSSPNIDRRNEIKENPKDTENVDHSEVPLSVALGDDDEILNFFLEYFSYRYGVPLPGDVNYYENMYKDLTMSEKDLQRNSDRGLFEYFRNTVIMSEKSEFNRALNISLKHAYDSFINESKVVFQGKASYYLPLKKEVLHKRNQKISPYFKVQNNHNAMTVNFIIINKNSKIDPSTLVKFALQLTSKNIQIMRGENFGSIPTIDFEKYASDPMLKKYCEIDEGKYCALIKELKHEPVDVKRMFNKNGNSPSFLEARLHIPIALRNYLNDSDVITMSQSYFQFFMDMKTIFSLSNMNYLILLTYILYSLFVIIMIITMIIVHKNRKHPYLKPISPEFCNVIIIGLILNVTLIPINASIHNVWQCYINSIIGVTIRTCTFFPFFAMTYRLYHIYKKHSEISIGKKLHNKNLFFLFHVILIINIIYGIIYNFFDPPFLMTLGYLYNHRFTLCYSEHYNISLLIIIIYYIILFMFTIYMIIRLGKTSYIYDEYKILFILIFVIFVTFISWFTFFKLDINNYSKNAFLIYSSSMGLHLLCVFFLVGIRIIRIMRKPVEEDSFNTLDGTFVDIADFVPLKKNRKRRKLPLILLSRNKNHSQHSLTENDDDTISSNPNNFFFNLTLEKLKNKNNCQKNNNDKNINESNNNNSNSNLTKDNKINNSDDGDNKNDNKNDNNNNNNNNNNENENNQDKDKFIKTSKENDSP